MRCWASKRAIEAARSAFPPWIAPGAASAQWRQRIAQLDVFPPNCFVFRAVHPWLLVRSAFCGVVTVNRIQRSDLEPARQQIGRRRTGKAADVIADEREPRNTHAQEHRRAHL